MKKAVSNFVLASTMALIWAPSFSQDIFSSVKSGNEASVVSAIKNKVDLNQQDLTGSTPLLLAVDQRQSKIVDLLLKAGADPNQINRYGAIPLHIAIKKGDIDTSLVLINNGADVEATTTEGETSLMLAAKSGKVEIIKALLDKKVNPNSKESWKGQTALMFAASEGHVDAIKMLVASGANVNDVSAEIKVPEPDPARRAGGFVYPKIPKGRLSALHIAARQGKLDAVQALIDSGANVNITDADGTTAAILATLNAYPDIAALLLNAGADPKVQDNYGRTVLFVATDMNTLDANPRPSPTNITDVSYYDLVKLAIQKGADVNVALYTGLPQWLAQGGGHNPILREGATTFLRASMSGDIPIMKLLLEAGADPLKATAPSERAGFGGDNSGKTTPLMAAAGVGWRDEISRGRSSDAIEAIKIILSKGGNINEANQGGNTPLLGAALRNDPKIVEFLIQNGADIKAKNGRGMTLATIAAGISEYRILPSPALAELVEKYSKQKVAKL